jgi:hypothetical protein
MNHTVTFFCAIALASCAATTQRFQSSLHEIGGSGAKSCGLVALHQTTEQSVSCALASLVSHSPFTVGFQLQGIDSQIWVGLAMSKNGTPQLVHFDSDPSGGAVFPHPIVVVAACPSPTISVSPAIAISCSNGR